MKYVRFAFPFISLAVMLFILTAVIAWQPDTTTVTSKNYFQTTNDTTAPKSAGADQIDIQLNLDSVMQQVNLALTKIDYAKMNADVQKAMAQIDYNKMNLAINKAMKDIDWNKMKADVSMALDSAKMALNSIDWDEMKANMRRAQEEARKAMAVQKLNSDSLKKQIQKSLQDAQRSLQSAQLKLNKYKELQDVLKKDGLIAEDKPYRVELKDGLLYINGVRQSKAITDKYSRYYPDKKNFSINGDGETDL